MALLLSLAASLPFSGPTKPFHGELGEKLLQQLCIFGHAGGGNRVSPEHQPSEAVLRKNHGGPEETDRVISEISFGATGMPSVGGALTEENMGFIATLIIMNAQEGWSVAAAPKSVQATSSFRQRSTAK